MKTDFSVQIHVDLGVTPELVALVNAIIGHRQMPLVEATQQPAPAESEQQQAKPRRGRKAATAEPEPEAPAQETEQPEDASEPEAEAAPEAEPEPESQEPKELTEQDIREAMHRTRQRIEGENYKDETDGELYKKYHRQLTAQFKNIAALLGSDKPSALPAEQRASFIKQCDELEVLEDGTIGTKCPY